ncbi:MAG: thiamine pyrophosphate-dependent enzyme [Nitrososphaerales archaeon]
MESVDCIKALKPVVGKNLLVVWGTTKTIEWLKVNGEDKMNVFTSYAMGEASMVGLGLALALPHRTIFVLDGDGALLMNLGCLTTLANKAPKNLIHILFDNGSYVSGGRLPTFSKATDYATIAKAASIKFTRTAKTVTEFKTAVRDAVKKRQTAFIVAKVGISEGFPDLGTMDALENKYRFIRYVESLEKKQILPDILKLQRPPSR